MSSGQRGPGKAITNTGTIGKGRDGDTMRKVSEDRRWDPFTPKYDERHRPTTGRPKSGSIIMDKKQFAPPCLEDALRRGDPCNSSIFKVPGV